jgi:hypothetical protein
MIACAAANHCSNNILNAGQCTLVNIRSTCLGSLTTTAMTAAGSTATGGTCTPEPTTTVIPPTWAVTARACVSDLAPAQVDCQAGSICAPQPSGQYGSHLCIAKSGSVACPTTGYTNRQVFYGSVTDTRACSQCLCGSFLSATCNASVQVYASTNLSCTGNAITYVAPFACDAVQQPADFKMVLTPSNGSCSIAGPVSATGSATPASPTTFCCAN